MRVDGKRTSVTLKKRRTIEGPIRIPLHSQLFLFNALAFPCIPSKSLKFRLVVFSIPTAPTNHPFSQQQLSDLSRRQKAAIRASRVAPMARMNESQRCCTKVGRWTAHQRIASFPRTLFRDREGHMYDYRWLGVGCVRTRGVVTRAGRSVVAGAGTHPESVEF